MPDARLADARLFTEMPDTRLADARLFTEMPDTRLADARRIMLVFFAGSACDLGLFFLIKKNRRCW